MIVNMKHFIRMKEGLHRGGGLAVLKKVIEYELFFERNQDESFLKKSVKSVRSIGFFQTKNDDFRFQSTFSWSSEGLADSITI